MDKENIDMKEIIQLPEKARILVVDDEPVILKLIVDVLAKEGHKIYTADNGSDALNILNEISIDILITDIKMPGMDGVQLIEEVKKINPEILVMVVTGFPEINSAINLLKSGVYNYIGKPIDPDEVVASVARGWERQSLSYKNKHLLQNLKISNEALRLTNENFNNIANKSIDGILILDKKGVARFINPSAEILFNRSSDEIMGELFGLPFVSDEMMEVDILRNGGEKGIAEMRVIDTEWEGESALLALLRDVTERKRAEEALERTTYDLRQTVGELKRSNEKILEQQKSVIEEERLKVLLQMAGATVHELSQPLMSLLGNIDLMKLYKDRPEKLDKHVNAIEEASQRISGIIRRIRNIESDDTKPYPGETCIINLDQKLKTLIVEDVDKDYEKIKNYLKDQNQISLFRTASALYHSKKEGKNSLV